MHAVVEMKSGERACADHRHASGESRLFALLGPTGYFLRLWLWWAGQHNLHSDIARIARKLRVIAPLFAALVECTPQNAPYFMTFSCSPFACKISGSLINSPFKIDSQHDNKWKIEKFHGDSTEVFTNRDGNLYLGLYLIEHHLERFSTHYRFFSHGRRGLDPLAPPR